MSDKKMEKKLRHYAKEETPDVKERIKASSVYRDFMDKRQPEPKKTPGFNWNRRLAFGGTLALLILAFVFVFPLFQAEASSTVYMDINPSLRLEVGEDDFVKRLDGENQDGEDFLEGLSNLRNQPFDDVIDILVEEAIDRGYLSEDNPYLMFDVISDNEDLQARHLAKMEERLPEVAQDRVPNFALMRGSSEGVGEEERERAQQHGISVMKSRIIDAILEETDDYDYETLSEYSVGQLRDLMDDYDISPKRPGPPQDTPRSGCKKQLARAVFFLCKLFVWVDV